MQALCGAKCATVGAGDNAVSEVGSQCPLDDGQARRQSAGIGQESARR